LVNSGLSSHALTVPDGDLPPHQPHCLGCGDQNPASLGLRLRRDGDRIRGEFTLDRRHEGAPGFAHGGAISTALDDALGSLLMILERPAVTAKLEVNFRRPALLGRPFEVETWVEGIEGRKLGLAGELRDAGELVADARGLFIEVGVEHFLEGAGELPPDGRDQAGRAGFELPW
jgi:acyl-coenzyme A thioesterase PaaI-like protein